MVSYLRSGVFFLVTVCLMTVGSAFADTINVTTFDDALGNPELCSLRAATISANYDVAIDGCESGNGDDVIEAPEGTYNLTISCMESGQVGSEGTSTPTETPFETPTATPTPTTSYEGDCGRLVLFGNTVINGGGEGIVIDASQINDRVLGVYAPEYLVNSASLNASAGALPNDVAQVYSAATDEHASSALRDRLAAKTGALNNAPITSSAQGDVGAAWYECQGSCQVGPVVVINNTTFQNGSEFAGGGIYISGNPCILPDVTLNSVTVKNNRAVYEGGGVYASQAVLHVNDSLITENSVYYDGYIYASTYGGGIYTELNNDTALNCGFVNTMDSSTVSNNEAGYGGGIASFNTVWTIDASHIDGNGGSLPHQYYSDGGGIYNFGDMDITDSSVSNNGAGNTTYGEGGAIVHGSSRVDCGIAKGIDSVGGDDDDDDDDFYSSTCNPSTMNIVGSEINGNQTRFGGAIVNYANMNIGTTTIADNSATFFAGAIINAGSSFGLRPLNAAVPSGYSFFRVGKMDISHSTISGNQAIESGAIHTFTELSMDNSTISGNTAFQGGGGGLTVEIYPNSTQLFPVGQSEGSQIVLPEFELAGDEATINNVTITDNKCDQEASTDYVTEYLNCMVDVGLGAAAGKGDCEVQQENHSSQCLYAGMAQQGPGGPLHDYNVPAGGGVSVLAGTFVPSNTIIAGNQDGGACTVPDMVKDGVAELPAEYTNPVAPDVYGLLPCTLTLEGETPIIYCYSGGFNGPTSATSDDDDDLGFIGEPAIISRGYNLVGDLTGGEIWQTATGDKLGSAESPINPGLAPLANNGGPTQTHQPLAGSAAIDMGNPVEVASSVIDGDLTTACEPDDQIGLARPIDGNSDNLAVCDIGAVEAPTDRCGVVGGDGTSCLGCTSIDIKETQFALDGGAAVQRDQVNYAAGVYRREGASRKQVKAIKAKAHSLYEQNWSLTWSLPSVQTTCTSTVFCVNVDNAPSINSYASTSLALKNLLNSTVNKLTTLSAEAKKRLKKKARRAHERNLKNAGLVPTVAQSCS